MILSLCSFAQANTLAQYLFTISLKVPRNPTNFAFICTQVGLILDIFLFFVCKKHYFEK